MNVWRFSFVCIFLLFSIVTPSEATDVFYRDKVRISPNGRFKIEAVSLKNKDPRGMTAFADEFVYTLTDTVTQKTLWTRNQGQNESSCASLHIDDDGWVVIATGWDELIPVAPDGRVTGRIQILEDALTKKERSEFVSDTTAGPMWAGYSEWYYTFQDNRRLFVIRPWWGRRIVVDLELGKLVEETPAMAVSFTVHETAKVLHDLEQAVTQREKWDIGDCCDGVLPVLKASFLAGCLGVEDAIPYLEALQDSNYSGSSTLGGLGYGHDFSGRVNPHNYSTFTLRQVIRFALRRLGKVPKFLPCHEFKIRASDSNGKDLPYEPKAKATPGAVELKKARKGMSAEEALDLLGAPEWITYDTWEYDIDINPPITLHLKWDDTKVVDVTIQKPASWQGKLVREQSIAR